MIPGIIYVQDPIPSITSNSWPQKYIDKYETCVNNKDLEGARVALYSIILECWDPFFGEILDNRTLTEMEQIATRLLQQMQYDQIIRKFEVTKEILYKDYKEIYPFRKSSDFYPKTLYQEPWFPEAPRKVYRFYIKTLPGSLALPEVSVFIDIQ